MVSWVWTVTWDGTLSLTMLWCLSSYFYNKTIKYKIRPRIKNKVQMPQLMTCAQLVKPILVRNSSFLQIKKMILKSSLSLWVANLKTRSLRVMAIQNKLQSTVVRLTQKMTAFLR
jgi:hypothetical protein